MATDGRVEEEGKDSRVAEGEEYDGGRRVRTPLAAAREAASWGRRHREP